MNCAGVQASVAPGFILGETMARHENISSLRRQLEAGLRSFFGQFAPTLQLVDDLIRAKTHPQEILILLCARLDALASTAAREEMSRQRAFTDFVIAYGGRRKLLSCVSVGDLYYELGYHRWLLPGGLIERPGRIRRFSALNDPMILFLDRSGVALTSDDTGRLLSRIMYALREAFRVMPRQPLTKRQIATTDQVTEAVVSKLKGGRPPVSGDVLADSLRPVLSSKTVASILYEKYRCGVIHGGNVRLNQAKFFTETELYWEPMHSEYYGGFLLVEFPAQFLAGLCRQCMATYQQHLLAKGKVPPDIHFQAFGDEMFPLIQLLDEELLPETRSVGLKLPTR